MEKMSAAKFVAGYSPTGFLKSFSIMTKIFIILLAGYLLWVGIIKPNTKWRLATTTQRAEQIVNNTYNPEKKSLVSFKLWFLKISMF